MKIYFSCSQSYNYECILNVGERVNILISQIYSKSWIKKDWLLDIKKKNLLDTPFILDSGAFTVWKSGGLIDLDEYIKVCNVIYDLTEGQCVVINVDVIPGKYGYAPSKKNIEDSCQQGYDNYLYMKKNFAGAIMPVFHQHDSYDWLHRYLDHQPEILGISPANDKSTKGRMPFLDKCFSVTQDKQKTHGLAVVSQTLLERYPFYSVDAATFSHMTAFGHVFYFDKGKLKGFHYANNKKNKRIASHNLYDSMDRKQINPKGRQELAIKAFLQLQEEVTKLWASRGIIY